MEAIGLLHGVVPVLFTARPGRVGSIMEAERIRVLLWEGRRSGSRRIPVDMQQSPCSPKASPRQLYHKWNRYFNLLYPHSSAQSRCWNVTWKATYS